MSRSVKRIDQTYVPNKTSDKYDLVATAERRTLVLIFLIYPSLNNAVFRIFTCR